jgi:hypothetical protein
MVGAGGTPPLRLPGGGCSAKRELLLTVESAEGTPCKAGSMEYSTPPSGFPEANAGSNVVFDVDVDV